MASVGLEKNADHKSTGWAHTYLRIVMKYCENTEGDSDVKSLTQCKEILLVYLQVLDVIP